MPKLFLIPAAKLFCDSVILW